MLSNNKLILWSWQRASIANEDKTMSSETNIQNHVNINISGLGRVNRPSKNRARRCGVKVGRQLNSAAIINTYLTKLHDFVNDFQNHSEEQYKEMMYSLPSANYSDLHIRYDIGKNLWCFRPRASCRPIGTTVIYLSSFADAIITMLEFIDVVSSGKDDMIEAILLASRKTSCNKTVPNNQSRTLEELMGYSVKEEEPVKEPIKAAPSPKPSAERFNAFQAQYEAIMEEKKALEIDRDSWRQKYNDLLKTKEHEFAETMKITVDRQVQQRFEEGLDEYIGKCLAEGYCTNWVVSQGFGFVETLDKTVFVHGSVLNGCGLKQLTIGQQVKVNVIQDPKRPGQWKAKWIELV